MVSLREVAIFTCIVHGHHVYKAVRSSRIGECLTVLPEMGNQHDSNVTKHRGIISRVLQLLLQMVVSIIAAAA